MLQIHDELLFEAPEAEVEQASEIVCREMADAFEMDPPLEVDVGAGATGWRPSRRLDKWLPAMATVAAGGLVAHAGADQLDAGQVRGNLRRGVPLVRDRPGGAGVDHARARAGFGDVGQATDLRWYYLTGGLLGAAYVTTVLVAVRTLGAGGVTAATIAGQLSASVAIDRAGILGLPEKGLTAGRVAGIVLSSAVWCAPDRALRRFAHPALGRTAPPRTGAGAARSRRLGGRALRRPPPSPRPWRLARELGRRDPQVVAERPRGERPARHRRHHAVEQRAARFAARQRWARSIQRNFHSCESLKAP